MARFVVGRAVDLSDQVGPALIGAALAVAVLALAAVPALLSPSPVTAPTTPAIRVPAGQRLPDADVGAIQRLVRARFRDNRPPPEMRYSLEWGTERKLSRVQVLSADQVGRSGDAALAGRLRTLAAAYQQQRFETYSIAAVTYASREYFYDRRAGKGTEISPSKRTEITYLGFGKRDGYWYELEMQ